MKATKYKLTRKYIKYEQVWGVESASVPGKVYTVAKDKQGTWSCSCPRWTLNASRPACKHINHVRALNWRGDEAEMPPQVIKKLTEFALIEL